MKRGVTCCDEGGVIIGEAKGGHINGEVVLVRQRQPHLHIMLHKNTGGEAYSRINTRITRGKGQKNKKDMPQAAGLFKEAYSCNTLLMLQQGRGHRIQRLLQAETVMLGPSS